MNKAILTQQPRETPRPLIYISGGITGRTPAEYTAHFESTAQRLIAQGYDVINPLNNGLSPGASWESHMRADIRLLTLCDEIFMLKGWESSEGASAEHRLACSFRMPIAYEEPPKHPELKQAIFTALGVTFRQMSQHGRKRAVVYARFIYCHHARDKGDSPVMLAAELCRRYSDVSYYLRKYSQEYKFNREFRNAARAVADLLNLNTQEE